MNSVQTHDAPDNARDFLIERVFAAPRERVFEAWRNAQLLARWWGPQEFTAPICEIDLRPGGKHHIVMRAPDGEDYGMRGDILEVAAPERIVLTMDCSDHPAEWHDMVDPHRGSNPNPAGVMHTTVTFATVDGQTKLSIRTRFRTPGIRDAMVNLGMQEGWSQSLDRLAALLAAS